MKTIQYLLPATMLGLLQACAQTPAPAPAPGPATGNCVAGAAQFAVGQPLTAQLRADALQRSGAKTLRSYRTGDAITMDFSPQRLNLETDASGKVVKASCG